jgi:predicted RNase H-like HicB family nuclease
MGAYLWIGPRGIEASLPVEVFSEAGGFVARCAALRVSSQGESKEEAGEALKEALQMFVEETAKAGTLAEALGECGWKRLSAPPADFDRPVTPGSELFSFVPVESLEMNLGPISIPT